jgi:hypothetical protein
MINENDFADILTAVENSNRGNIGCLVTCAKIRELVKYVIAKKLDDMAAEHEAAEYQHSRAVMAEYYSNKKKQGISKEYILQQLARDKELLSFVFNKEV